MDANVFNSCSLPCTRIQLSQGSQNYHFGYEVSEDEVQFGHEETRDGDRVVGEYQVLLPNGYRQVNNCYIQIEIIVLNNQFENKMTSIQLQY